MSNSSNQTGILAILAIVLAVIVYATMFFGSKLEQKNLSSSYGTIALPNSGLSSNKVKLINDKYAATESRSDLSGITLPSYNKETKSSSNYSEPTETDFPSSAVAPVDVQAQSNHKQNMASTRYDGSYLRNQLVASAMVISQDVQYIINTQGPPTKTDLDASFMLIQERTEQAASTSQQGSKRTIGTGKAGSASTDLSSKNGAKKVEGNPGEPGVTLPIGDGVWLMLMFAGVYSLVSLTTKQLQLKEKKI